MKYSLSKNTKSKITLWSYYIKQNIYKALQNSNTREADSTKNKKKHRENAKQNETT